MTQDSDQLMVSSFYKFCDLRSKDLPALKADLQIAGDNLSVLGLFLLSQEGINASIAGKTSAVIQYRELINSQLGITSIEYKDNPCQKNPFHRLKIDLRQEIITFNEYKYDDAPTSEMLSPSAWHQALMEAEEKGEKLMMIDVRNSYETRLGKFRDTIDPEINKFTEFHDYLKKAPLPRDKKVFIYCTGGVRCEKAAITMKREGFKEIYQLQGGILKYLEEFPDQAFEGECFVFDQRVSVDQKLEPSKRYHLCPHCGDPGDQKITCINCGTDSVVCKRCNEQTARRTCSKNCCYHASIKSADNKATSTPEPG